MIVSDAYARKKLRDMVTSFDTGALTVGASPDYSEFEADGTLVMHGDATVWDDVTFPLAAYRLDSGSGKLQQNYDNASITMQSGGSIATAADRLVITCQMPHKTKLDSTAELHIHWEQPADQAYTFDYQYRIQENGEAKDATWSTAATVAMSANAFTYVSGTLIQITPLISIDLTGIGLSSLIQVRIARSDSTTGDIEALALDFHFEFDTLGSNEEYVK